MERNNDVLKLRYSPTMLERAVLPSICLGRLLEMWAFSECALALLLVCKSSIAMCGTGGVADSGRTWVIEGPFWFVFMSHHIEAWLCKKRRLKTMLQKYKCDGVMESAFTLATAGLCYIQSKVVLG